MMVLIVDDELLARQRLCRQLAELGYPEPLEASNGLDALDVYARYKPDLVLVDIRMPVMDGVELAQQLAGLDNPPAVIFTTAFAEHALQAFDSHAIAYLLKPVRKEKLAAALEHASTLNRVQRAALSNAEGQDRTHISARVGDNLERVAVEDIIYFHADQKYVAVCTTEQRLLIDESLKALEQEFTRNMVRIHRNALVRMDKCRALEKTENGYFLVFNGCEDRLEVSRRHLPEIRALIKKNHN